MSRTNKTNYIILKETFLLHFFAILPLVFRKLFHGGLAPPSCKYSNWLSEWFWEVKRSVASCEGPKNSEIRELQWEDLDIKLHIKTGVYGAISFALRSKHFCGAYLLRIANCFLHNFSPKIHVQNSWCSVFSVCTIYSTKKAKNSLKIMSFSVCLFAERQL